MTGAKVELGRRLFADLRLSGNRTSSCASCHDPDRAFTDGRARAVGSTGQQTRHGATTLYNSAYGASFGWTHEGPGTLEGQIEIALFNTSPVELGLAGQEARVRADLHADPGIRRAFALAFPDDHDAVSLKNVTRALAAYIRTLIAGNSPYDRLLYQDDQGALSNAALRGMRLFHSTELGCSACHSGFNFSGPVRYVGARAATPVFHRARTAGDGEGFRAPTLRNIALTAPYMHDGRFATLPEVIRHYAAAPRPADVPEAGERLTGFALGETDVADLVAFLESLTDEPYTSRSSESKRQSRQRLPLIDDVTGGAHDTGGAAAAHTEEL